MKKTPKQNFYIKSLERLWLLSSSENDSKEKDL